ncbi:MAG: hypothetical protein HYZ50_01845 [Deltaproteobacteria bacterium]|nr:hypothetical protein [Deltaproteobacteria bacterium]
MRRRTSIDRMLVKITLLCTLLIAAFSATAYAKEPSLDARHQLLIAATEAAQGIVVALTEDEAFTSPAAGMLQVQGTFNDTQAHVMVGPGQLGSFFDIFVDIDLQRAPLTGAMNLAVTGHHGAEQVQVQQSSVRFLEFTPLDPKLEKEAVEQVMDLDMVGTIGPRFWDCEIVKYFRFFRGGQVITDRGVKIITRNGFIRAKYVEFSLWVRKGPIRFDRIIERRIFPPITGPAPDAVELNMQTSVAQATDTLMGTMTVTPAAM